MACKIEIKKTVDNSINQQLPDRNAVYSKDAANKIASNINDLWDSTIAKTFQYSSEGGYKVIISDPESAVEKEYLLQKEAEKSFIRDINFYGGDEALMNQEEGDTNVMFQNSNSTNSKASKQTLDLIKDFLKRSGIEWKEVNNLIVNGKKVDANGVANITKALIQVAEGKEATALPEEAMHFVIELIQLNNPALFKQLLKESNSYALTSDVFKRYSKNPFYQTEEGKPDILKLKKEAMGQILAETVIKQNEGNIGNTEQLRRTFNLWERIVNWLKELINKSGFSQTAIDFLSNKDFGEAQALLKNTDDIYLTNTRRDDTYNDLIATHKEVKLKKKVGDVWIDITPEDPVEQDDEQSYFYGDKKISKRVSDLIYSWYDQQFKGKRLTNSEYTNAVWDLKAEKGTAGHKDFEHMFEVFVDENGFMREEPLSDETYSMEMKVADVDAYAILKENFRQRLLSYGKNTRFITELKVYDPQRDVAGTIDFVAIEEDGTVNLLDWKFMDLNIEKYDDVPWFKVNAWNQQIKQYKYIVARNYGVKENEFGHTRMIPIKAYYTYGNAKTNVLPTLLRVEIGDVNVENITDDYLLPVGITEEKVYDTRLAGLIKKLNSIYDKMSDTKVLPDQKASKSEQLNSLYTAIRKLQIQKNIVPLLQQAKILQIQAGRVIQEFENVYVKHDKDGKVLKNKDKEYIMKDAKKFKDTDISAFSISLEDSLNYIKTYTTLEQELVSLLDDTTEEGQKFIREVQQIQSKASTLLFNLMDVDKTFTSEIIAKSVAILDITNPEKTIRGISRYLGTTATLQMKSLQVLYKKAQKAFTYAAMDTRTEINRLQTIKSKYSVWAGAKGLSSKDKYYFASVVQKDKNKLIDQFKPEFYTLLKTKREEKDYTWIKDNIDAKLYKEHLKEKLDEEIVRIKNKVRIDTPEKNELLEKIEISKAQSLYTISQAESVGWLLEDAKKFPLEDKWESQEWKELNKSENKPALDLYNYIKERNEFFVEIGYLNGRYARTFLPWVRKGLTEKLIFGGKITLGEQFLRNITLEESDTEFGQIDPLTGQPVDTVPILLTTEFEEEYSQDLFKTLGMYNEFGIKFMYLKEIEAQMNALNRLEKNKEAIATSYFGKTQKSPTGDPDHIKDNTSNTKLFEQMKKAIIYQQRYIESEMFDTILGKVRGQFKTINKALGFDLLPESSMSDRVFSVNKSVTQLNTHYQLVVLGWSPLSSLSNLFGGKTQSFINSGRYFTKKDYVSTEHWLLAHKMGGVDKKLHLSALEYFLPFTDNFNREAINKLSLSKLSQESLQDYLMYLMRNSDRAVQTTNFFTFLKNTIVIDDRIVNAREHVRTYTEYQDMYAGTEEDRSKRKEAFENEVKKLIKDKAILNTAKVSEDGVFSIPGVNRKDDSVVDFVTKVQQFTNDALGNVTEANKRLINMTVFGNSAMVFKNWIPRLVDVRTGNLKYNVASDAYEWGRSRMIFRFLSEDLFKSLGSLHDALVGNDKGIARVKKMFEDKKKDYEADTGKKLDMDESIFIDLVRQNIENQLYDTMFYAALFSLTAGFKALAPDEDEEMTTRNQWKFIVRATDKLTDELGYFYNPANILGLFGRGVFPTVTLIDNYKKGIGNFMKESYGIILGDEELVEDTSVIKYWMKTFPILNQAANFLPMFAPELGKDLGLKMQSTYNR